MNNSLIHRLLKLHFMRATRLAGLMLMPLMLMLMPGIMLAQPADWSVHPRYV